MLRSILESLDSHRFGVQAIKRFSEKRILLHQTWQVVVTDKRGW